MKKYLFIALLCVTACKNEPAVTETNVTETSASAYTSKYDRSEFNTFLKNIEDTPQILTVSAKKPSSVKGKKGTVITVNPADLETESGKPLGSEINVELKELTNVADLLKNNAQTVSGRRCLLYRHDI